jgi:hypothetical protein
MSDENDLNQSSPQWTALAKTFADMNKSTPQWTTLGKTFANMNKSSPQWNTLGKAFADMNKSLPQWNKVGKAIGDLNTQWTTLGKTFADLNKSLDLTKPNWTILADNLRKANASLADLTSIRVHPNTANPDLAAAQSSIDPDKPLGATPSEVHSPIKIHPLPADEQRLDTELTEGHHELVGAADEAATPPAAEKILSLLISPDRLEEVVGDFEQGYRFLLKRHGRGYARLWYWGQVFMVGAQGASDAACRAAKIWAGFGKV